MTSVLIISLSKGTTDENTKSVGAVLRPCSQSVYQWDLLPLQIQPLSIQDSCQNPQTKDTLLRSYFWLTVCKYPYFSQKLRKHCLVQNADVGKQNLPTLMASEIAVIRKPDFMDPMNLFPSDAKVTCTCQQDCTYKYVWYRLKEIT